MIEIKPCEKTKSEIELEFENLYKALNIESGSSLNILVARENKNLIGNITVDIFDYYLRILKINILVPDSNNSILDLLIRACASYALNRKTFVMQCLDKDFFDKLKTLNFYESNSNLFLEIHKLPKSCMH